MMVFQMMWETLSHWELKWGNQLWGQIHPYIEELVSGVRIGIDIFYQFLAYEWLQENMKDRIL